MDEDPLHRHISFLTFAESLEMIFSQFTETCGLVIEEIIVRNHCQTCHQRKRNTIKRKSVVKTEKMTRQTHLRATIQTQPMTVITDRSKIKRSAINKGSDQIMRTFNGKVADDSV